MIATLAAGLVLSLNVSVDGEGYLRFIREGRIVYATSANLTVHQGMLSVKELPVAPAIRIPANAVRLEVDLSGNVTATVGTSKTLCGRFVLARLATAPTTDRGFMVSSGRASIGNPGEGLFGVIRGSGASSTTPNGEFGVVVNELTEVEGDQVTLADIATINGDAQTKASLGAIVVGSSPAIGVDQPVLQARVEGLIKRAGLTAKVMVPKGAVIRRKAQMIKHDDFVAAATAAAQAKLGAEIPLTCTDTNRDDFRAPLGQVELKAEATTLSGLTMAVTVAVYVEGRRVNSRSVSLKADASAQVRPGAAVKIVMKSAGVVVEVGGKTRTGGMVGQTVTVVTDTGTVLSGVVVGADRIEVKV